MNKINNYGKLRAFFDLELQGIIIKGFKIIEGINGLFVSMPSQKDKEGKYSDTVYCLERETKDELNKIAIDYYNMKSIVIEENQNYNQDRSKEIINDEAVPF